MRHGRREFVVTVIETTEGTTYAVTGPTYGISFEDTIEEATARLREWLHWDIAAVNTRERRAALKGGE